MGSGFFFSTFDFELKKISLMKILASIKTLILPFELEGTVGTVLHSVVDPEPNPK